jgi:hypothetical protein
VELILACLVVSYIFAYRLPLTAYCAVKDKPTPWVAAKQARLAETSGSEVAGKYGSTHNPRSLRGFFAAWWGDLWEDAHTWRAERHAGQPERRAEREARRRNGESRLDGVRGRWRRCRDWLQSLRRAGRGDRSGWLPEWLPFVDRPAEGEQAEVPDTPDVADTDEALAWALNDTDTHDPDPRELIDRVNAELAAPVSNGATPPTPAHNPTTGPAAPVPAATEPPQPAGTGGGNPAGPRPGYPLPCTYVCPTQVGDEVIVAACGFDAAPGNENQLCDKHQQLIDSVRNHTCCRWELGVKPPCPNPIDPRDGMFCTEHINEIHRRYLASLDPPSDESGDEDGRVDGPDTSPAESTPESATGVPAVPPATPQVTPAGRPHLSVVPNPDSPTVPSGPSEGVSSMADTKTAPTLTAEEAASVQALDGNADDMVAQFSNAWPTYVETVESNITAAGLARNKAIKAAMGSFDEAIAAARHAAQDLKKALAPQVALASEVSETEDHGTDMKAYENSE